MRHLTARCARWRLTGQRNGYFFTLDRVTGEHLVTGKMGLVNNWALGLDEQGRPKRNPTKTPRSGDRSSMAT